MPEMNIILSGDGAWPDLDEKLRTGEARWYADSPIHENAILSLAALPEGMSSGKTSVAIRIDMPSGRTVVVETSLALLNAAVRAFNARYEE